MATARPVVSVYQHDDASKKTGTIPMPHVMTSPLRPDLVRFTHMNMAKNRRQAYAVSAKAGYDTAAESWGTGRAVARIPRVPGGGTHRSGQAAFGNMCRGGGMFCPTKTWRRWHRKTNVTLKRHAVATALAASALPPLVMARGHRINDVSELPLVITDEVQGLTKTKQAIDVLKKQGCEVEIDRINKSRKARCGHSRMRNRKYVVRNGPIVVYAEDNGIKRAFRNIPGIETAHVDRLNLLKLAPGGAFGRFLIWTESAFRKITQMYGTPKSAAPLKAGYRMPRAVMENADLARIINSDEVQSVLRPKLQKPKRLPQKKNPLKNSQMMAKLNPGFLQKRAMRKRAREEGTAERAKLMKVVQQNKESAKKSKKDGREYYKALIKAFEPKPKVEEAEEAEDDE